MLRLIFCETEYDRKGYRVYPFFDAVFYMFFVPAYFPCNRWKSLDLERRVKQV